MANLWYDGSFGKTKHRAMGSDRFYLDSKKSLPKDSKTTDIANILPVPLVADTNFLY
jgi:hypothetical protein